MKLTVTSLLLAILQCRSALSAAVQKRATKEVTLDIVNADLAPDGFMRSMCLHPCMSSYVELTSPRHCCRERTVSSLPVEFR